MSLDQHCFPVILNPSVNRHHSNDKHDVGECPGILFLLQFIFSVVFTHNRSQTVQFFYFINNSSIIPRCFRMGFIKLKSNCGQISDLNWCIFLFPQIPGMGCTNFGQISLHLQTCYLGYLVCAFDMNSAIFDTEVIFSEEDSVKIPNSLTII